MPKYVVFELQTFAFVEVLLNCCVCMQLNSSMDNYVIGVLGPLNFVFSPVKWLSDYGYTGDLFKTCLIICAVAQCSLWSSDPASSLDVRN